MNGWLDLFQESLFARPMIASRRAWALLHCQRFSKWLRERVVTSNTWARYLDTIGGAPASRRNVAGLLKQAATWAVRHGHLKAEVLDFPTIKVPVNPRTIIARDRMEELLRLFEGDRLYDLVLVALYTGARRNELLGLQAQDVDLVTGTITLRGERCKNGKFRRIPIHDRIRPILARLILSEPLFGNLRPLQVSKRFAKIAQAGGFPGVTFHSLRHSFISYLAQKGVNPFAIRELAGHASITTTMTYVHEAAQGINLSEIL